MKTGKIIYPLYVFFLLLISLAGLEWGARLRHEKAYLAANIQKDPVFHHRLGPHTRGTMSSEGDFDDTFVTNDRGMRGPGDYAYEKKEGVTRIAVMGDSFTFGVGVRAEETFSARLQRRLEEAQPGRYEVLNFGVSSFSPVLEYIYLKKEVAQYRPDRLILALDLCDVQDDYFYEKHLVYDKDGEIVACDPFRLHGGPDIWAVLKERSMLCAILDEKVLQSFKKMKTIGFAKYFENKRNKVRNKTAILLDPKSDNIEFDRFLFAREAKDEAIVRRHWERTAKYLSMIKEFCDGHSIRLLLAPYPYGHEVGPEEWSKGREYWGFEKGRVDDASRSFAMIGAFAREKGIDWVSLLEPMKAHENGKLYYHNDGHWTADGHRVAAEALFEKLNKEGL